MSGAIQLTGVPSHAERQRHFSLWSRTYDQAANPMLSLEERFLAPLLPQPRGQSVLDIGCGTGRWLQRLADRGALTLTGIDCSPEMLARAAVKMKGRATFAVGDATSLPVASTSADIILASFVASYVTELDAFAAELRRVARPSSDIFLSDVHPETMIACNWKRAFRGNDEVCEFVGRPRSLAEVICCLARAGLETVCVLEPPFGLDEFETFRRAGKLEAFHAADSRSAIYILQLRPVTHRNASANRATSARFVLRGGRIALSGAAAIKGDLGIKGDRVASILSSRPSDALQQTAQSTSSNLDGYLLLPGLINAHDHLEFGLYPNLGRGPYANAVQWAKDIQESDSATIAVQQSIPRDVRLWWGAIRNLLCGVTTVCHHNPLHPELLDQTFPLRLITNFGWAHSPALDEQLAAKFHSTPEGTPFVLHACEGLDDSSVSEVFELDRRGLVNHRTVVVHGLGLNPHGIEVLNRLGAALVWCPSSNRFLFGRTLSYEAATSVRQLLLGSDSPLTSCGDLLDEVRLAHKEIGIPAGELYSMVCDRAAAVFRLTDGQGTLRPGAVADVIAVRDGGLSPAVTLASLRTADVELVMVRGRVQVASEDMLDRLPSESLVGLEAVEVDGSVRWVRAPLARLFGETQRVLGHEFKIGGKRVRHVGAS